MSLYGVFFLPEPYCGLPQESDLPKHRIFSVDSIGRNFGCRDQKMDSSSALESYGSLLSNAPSLATIVWLLAKLQHERPATMLCQKNIHHVRIKKNKTIFIVLECVESICGMILARKSVQGRWKRFTGRCASSFWKYFISKSASGANFPIIRVLFGRGWKKHYILRLLVRKVFLLWESLCRKRILRWNIFKMS